MSTTPSAETDPTLLLENGDAIGDTIPQLGFGCYKVPASAEGEEVFRNAIQSGYRHFDTASYYGNEATLGAALRHSGIPRHEFFIASKVWNDAQKAGRQSVRKSVEQSLQDLDFGGYFDLYFVHWPVPGHYVDTYKELQLMKQEGTLRNLGLSNFSAAEYQHLMKSDGITIQPAVSQFEVSPFMYRPEEVIYFQAAGLVVEASKAIHRGGCVLEDERLKQLGYKYGVTVAQVMISWGIQKGFVVLTKTCNADRMRENRHVLHFSLSDDDMHTLDALTGPGAAEARRALEQERKKSM